MYRALIAFSATSLLAVFFFSSGAYAGDAAAGKLIFDANCSACHGISGKGDGPVGLALNPPPRDLTKAEFKFDPDGDGTLGSDADLKGVIQKGALAFGGSALMAPWPTLNDAQIADIIAHIRSLKE